MVVYFDTSALVKRYIREAGTEEVRDLFRNAQSIVVYSITKVELVSTLKRSLMEKRIEKSDYEKTWERIQNDFIDWGMTPHGFLPRNESTRDWGTIHTGRKTFPLDYVFEIAEKYSIQVIYVMRGLCKM